jgi:hypothetical protein
MKKTIVVLLELLLVSLSVAAQDNTEKRSVRIVAYDRYFGMTNPREPIQSLIAEIQGSPDMEKRLVKLIYMVKTKTGMVGDEQFIEPESLSYKFEWNAEIRRPDSRGKFYCGQVDNYTIFKESGGEDAKVVDKVLRFRSTLFPALVFFENIEDLPCYIADSMSQRTSGRNR